MSSEAHACACSGDNSVSHGEEAVVGGEAVRGGGDLQKESGSLIIAVDGPSGAGKSSVCRAVAERLGAVYVDTGAMYRVATLAVLRAGIDPSDRAHVAEEVRRVTISFGNDSVVYLNGEDVSALIRGKDVTDNVSAVSANAEVRGGLVDQQRMIAHNAGRAVLDGRDIGTVVLPHADLKVFLTASPEVRAQRRVQQDNAAGRPAEFNEVLESVTRRDALDSSRAVSPLRPADDAVVVDTSTMNIDEVIECLVTLAKRKETS